MNLHSCKLYRHLWICLALLGALASDASAGLISDPGFESATAAIYGTGPIGDGWQVMAGSMQVASGDGAVAHSGNQYLYLDQNNSVNVISQTFTTFPLETYNLSFWAADTFANNIQVELVNSSASADLTVNTTAPTGGVGSQSDYVQYSYQFTAGTNMETLAIEGVYSSGYGTIIDDVSVTPAANVLPISVPTPEPSTVLLMLMPLAAMGVFRHRFRYWRA